MSSQIWGGNTHGVGGVGGGGAPFAHHKKAENVATFMQDIQIEGGCSDWCDWVTSERDSGEELSATST